MRRLFLAACGLALVAGCVPSGPETAGRFPHGSIRRSIAPWDGPATEVRLAANPVGDGLPDPPFLTFAPYQAPEGLSKKRIRLDGKESRQGMVQWIDVGGKAKPVAWAEIEFGEVREGEPVTGRYEVAFPDGSRERGEFQATWKKSAGPGG